VLILIAGGFHAAQAYTEALTELGQLAFAYSRESEEARQLAISLRPNVTIVDLPAPEAFALCRSLRATPQMLSLKLLLVVPANDLAAAGRVFANGVVARPASPTTVAAAAMRLLRERERRDVTSPDRRSWFRGGRRLTDVDA
jgi:PleD family two-component response regulator